MTGSAAGFDVIGPPTRDLEELAVESGVAALYCRIPHRRDQSSVSVDEQERLGVAEARRIGLDLQPRHIFIDHRPLTWRRDRPRPGWDRLLSATHDKAFNHILLYKPENLALQPFDLAELFKAADPRRITLHRFGSGPGTEDGQLWAALRSEIDAVCNTRTAMSHGSKWSNQNAARRGQPHGGGQRPYGYTRGMGSLVAAEAAIVEEIFDLYLAGVTLRAIAAQLNARAVPTSTGKRWTGGGVARILDAPRYAGLRVHGGEVVAQPATWPTCVSTDIWERVQALRGRSSRNRTNPSRHRYLLTGLLVCTACGGHMVGSVVNSYRLYACPGPGPVNPEHRRRYIGADNLEALVVQRAVEALEGWVGPGLLQLPLVLPFTVSGQSTTTASRRAVTVRSAQAMDGVATGGTARREWRELTDERKAAVVRFLFTVIRVGPSTTARSVFDDSRVDMVPAPRQWLPLPHAVD